MSLTYMTLNDAGRKALWAWVQERINDDESPMQVVYEMSSTFDGDDPEGEVSIEMSRHYTADGETHTFYPQSEHIELVTV